MTQNYRRVTSQNTWLFEEAVRNGGPLSNNTEYTRQQALEGAVFRRKPESSATKAKRRYEGRRNSCPVCHLAMPASGECC